jgi:hypothetical protein
MKRKLLLSAAACLPLSVLALGAASAQPIHTVALAGAPLTPASRVAASEATAVIVITITVDPGEYATADERHAGSAQRAQTLDV